MVYDRTMDEPTWPSIMREQSALRGDMDLLHRWAADHPRTAAGLWFDNGPADAGPVRIGVGAVGDAEAVASRLRELVAHPESLDVVPRRFSDHDLTKVRDQVVAERMRTRTHPTCLVTAVGIDVGANQVTVGIDPFDEAFAAEIEAVYGRDRVVVEARSPVIFLSNVIETPADEGSR